MACLLGLALGSPRGTWLSIGRPDSRRRLLCWRRRLASTRRGKVYGIESTEDTLRLLARLPAIAVQVVPRVRDILVICWGGHLVSVDV